MMKASSTIRWMFTLVFAAALLLTAADVRARTSEPMQRGPVAGYNTQAGQAQVEYRVHDVGNIWLTITNKGYLGNDSCTSGQEDPCTGEPAPQLEFPGGSDQQYLFQAGLWVGALIQEEGFEYPRVSFAVEGWNAQDFQSNEMYPGPDPGNGIVEITQRQNAFNCLGEFISSDSAVSEQDFIAVYTDTHRVTPGGQAINDPTDGPHVPLGIRITQKSYSWSYNYARDFIIIDYTIKNIADKFLKNLYIGLYVDGDVGLCGAEQNYHTDDITGFVSTFDFVPPGQTDPINLTINSAYIVDNDGRAVGVSSGSDFTAPGVSGTRVVRAPNPKLRTSFNWWISNGDPNFDFGPAWVDDGSPGDWTATYGTPIGDARKYFVLSNREFDYDQIHVDDYEGYVSNNPQEFRDRFTGDLLEVHEWREADAANAQNLANGFDTRYLLSWGPLGIFDYIDDAGNRVYRLNPGEEFSMTIAVVGAEGFHDRNNPQPSDQEIDPTLFDLNDFYYNADWAAKVYDNPMFDTNNDGWYGEDTGLDSVYSESIGDTIEFIDWEGDLFSRVYPGPDEGELDGQLDPVEDEVPRPAKYDYTVNNELFDQGDGEPDFQGPPPPPVPIVSSTAEGRDLILLWEKNAEDSTYQDPFSRQQDFEGYRVYASNSGSENE
ncbi:hypothetical protein GF324_12500 [bacterium]|nr:hypothetical protein [bacterium]